MMFMKLNEWEHESEVMTKKRGLYGNSEKTEDDLTWVKRNMQYKSRQISEEEGSNEKNMGEVWNNTDWKVYGGIGMNTEKR